MARSGRQGTIPDGWELVRLGDVATPSQGGTPRKSRSAYWDGNVPFVTGADLTEFRISRENARSFLTMEGLRSGATAVCAPGELLLATRTRVGLAGMATEVMGASQDITRLVANGRIRSDYLCRVLIGMGPALQQKSRGTTIQGITREDVVGLPILLPPLPEQQAIAAVLDSIDDAIERTDAVIAATEQLRDSLLHELLTRGVPGWHTEWKEAPGIGTIPADWEVVRLGDVAEVNAHSWDPSEGNQILYLDLTAVVVPGVLAPPRDLAAREAPSRARRCVHSGDILVSTVRPNLRGFARVTSSPKNLIASTGFAVVTPKPAVSSSLLYHHVMTNQFANYLEGCTTGQAYPAVRPGDVANFRFAAPPLPEQLTIAKLLDRVEEAIEQEREERKGLQLLMESLAEGLLTGRVRVGSAHDV